MRKLSLTILAVLLLCTLALAQKPGFNGNSFTGKVTDGDDATGKITMTADVKGQTQTFTGVMAKVKITMPDGTKKELKPSDFPKDQTFTVKFKKKTDASGQPVNEVHDVQMSQ